MNGTFVGRMDTLSRKAEVLLALQECLTVSAAATATGVAVSTIWNWLATDPDFAEGRRQAQELATQRLEESMYARAFNETIPAIFMLKSLRPDKYQDKYQTQRDDRPNVIINIGPDQRTLSINAERSSHEVEHSDHSVTQIELIPEHAEPQGLQNGRVQNGVNDDMQAKKEDA